MRFLITAGPTREYLDTIRFISNASTGLTGFEIAREAARRGHQTVLVAGPTSLADPQGVEVVRVTSAEEMLQAVMQHLPESSVVIGTAAVCDWRPSYTFPHKRPKEDGPPVLSLEPTPDILKEVGKRKEGRLVIGFALEDTEGRSKALQKLKRKNMDYIVLNGPQNLGAPEGTYEIIDSKGAIWSLGKLAKTEFASVLVSLALQGTDALAGFPRLAPP